LAFIVPRLLLVLRGGAVAGAVTSAVGTVSAGLLTSVPVAGGTAGAGGTPRVLRDLAVAAAGVNAQLLVVPSTGISVNRLPFLRARKDRIVGTAVAQVVPLPARR